MATFFGFAIADGMFANCSGDRVILRRKITAKQAAEIVKQGVEPCLNPSHAATIAAMRERFGIDVPIPSSPPRVSLRHGDCVVVMGVRGLPRLTDRHEYTEEEVASATFKFSVYEVIRVPMRGRELSTMDSLEGAMWELDSREAESRFRPPCERM